MKEKKLEGNRMQLSFRFDSRMATLLGEQSVSNNIAAIFELVKNAYDADATRAEVIYHGKRDAKKQLQVTTITVRDNGVGMTFEDFRDKWMVVGTYTKEREIKSPKLDRRVVGEKGIGRFATQRLGNKVTIVSDPEEYPARHTEYPGERLIMTIEWNRYQPGTTFDEIGNEVKFVDRPSPTHSGLDITIEGLKDNWSEEQIRELNDRLGWLIVPPELAQETGQPFEVRIIAEGFVLERLQVEPALFRKSPYAILATLRGNKVHYTIYETGEVVVDTRSEGYSPMLFQGQCGDADFRLYQYPGDLPEDEGRWSRYYKKVLGAAQFEDMLENFHGVKLYNDGVRILPYGNPENDWLSLNKRYARRAASSLRNERVIGFVLISRNNNPLIKETTTRMGIIENQAFQDLQQFAIRCVQQLASYYQEKKKQARQRKAIMNIPAAVSSETEAIRSEIEKLPLPEEAKQEALQHLNRVVRYASEMERVRQEETISFVEKQQLYRNLASVGITTISFAHEIAHPLSSIELMVRNLVTDLYDGQVNRDKQIDPLLEISRHVANLLYWQKYIRAFATLLATSKRTEREQIRFMPFVGEMFTSFQGILKERNIQVRNAIPDYVPPMWMNRADLESIFVNLFTNSVKALRAVQDRQRIIQLTLVDSASHFKFRFSDTGIGIPPGEVQRIFEPLYTTYSGQDGGPKGTGMGLTILTEILEQYGGKIEVDKPEFGVGATFLLSIPWKEIQIERKQA